MILPSLEAEDGYPTKHGLGGQIQVGRGAQSLRLVPGLSAGRDKPLAGQKQAAERDYLPCSVELL
ncbi:MAG: hypothetical protein ABW185_13115, partial [Sedimenticola sp.]